MQKRVLVTGGSHAELPLIRVAKADGCFVITTGNNREGMGHQEADKYVPGDFSDKEFILSLAREEKIDAIVSGCNDFAYLSAAYAAEKLNIPGHDTYENAKIIHHKDAFRELLWSLQLPAPRAVRCTDEEGAKLAVAELGLPAVVKPVDLTGGKGVKICRTMPEVMEAFRTAKALTREKYIILESYVSGSNHGFSMLVKNEKVTAAVFDDEQYGMNQYLVLGASMPSETVTPEAEKMLVSAVEKIFRHLHLVDGLFHGQFILQENGIPVIIDPCRRAPGDLYVLLAKYHSGIDYPQQIYRAETNQELCDSYVQANNYIARECIMAHSTGIVHNISIPKDMQDHIIDRMIWGGVGDAVDDYLKYKAGILFFRYDDADSLKAMISRYQDEVKIEFGESV